mgnify:CR=1 FL=1
MTPASTPRTQFVPPSKPVPREPTQWAPDEKQHYLRRFDPTAQQGWRGQIAVQRPEYLSSENPDQ